MHSDWYINISTIGICNGLWKYDEGNNKMHETVKHKILITGIHNFSIEFKQHKLQTLFIPRYDLESLVFCLKRQSSVI